MVGQIIGGKFDEILIRKKNDEVLEMGDLLVCGDILLQVFDQEYASLLDGRELARISGMQLEGYENVSIRESELRNFTVVKARPVFDLRNRKLPKYLPPFMSQLERVREEHLQFLNTPQSGLYMGRVRSGNRILDISVYLNPSETLSHHILVAAATGRGKSNFMKVLLWNLVPEHDVGILVLDAHNEYYQYTENGRNYGLSQHPDAYDNVFLYTPTPRGLPGEYSLRINIRSVRPSHLREIVSFTSAQEDAISLIYRSEGERWIESILTESFTTADGRITSRISGVSPVTLAALQRKLMVALDLQVVSREGETEIRSTGNVFTAGVEGLSTIRDIANHLDRGRIVVVDTSTMPGNMEIMISSMIMTEVFENHRRCKEGTLPDCDFQSRPVVSVVLEEAPRVLGEGSGNIFKTIAREGRKFKVGIIAITQLPSMIPKEIMANLNTKIILGNDMESERSAIISSAPQDLSKDSKTIASLTRGEAIISSIFTMFPIPVKMDRFEEMVDRIRRERRGRTRQITL